MTQRYERGRPEEFSNCGRGDSRNLRRRAGLVAVLTASAGAGVSEAWPSGVGGPRSEPKAAVTRGRCLCAVCKPGSMPWLIGNCSSMERSGMTSAHTMTVVHPTEAGR